MADVETAIYTLLTTYKATNDLISMRCYPVRLPQKPTLPALTYQRISASREHTHDGCGLVEARFQVDCYADEYSGVRALVNAVRGVLNRFVGSVGGVRIGSILMENEVDFVDDDLDIFRVVLDFMVMYGE